MINLYPDQKQLINDIRAQMKDGHKRIMVQMETGGGKTIVASFMMHSANQKGLRCAFVVPRKELLRQTAKTFNSFGMDFSYVASGLFFDKESQNWLCSMQTFVKRLDLIQPDMIINDEAHFGQNMRDKIDGHYGRFGAWIIGLSATPEYPSGDPMSLHYDVMVQGKPLSWMIENRRLSDYRAFGVYSPDISGVGVTNGEFKKGQLDSKLEQDRVLVGNVVQHYKQHAMGKRHMTFANSVKKSKEFAQAFNDAGVPSAHMDGDTPDAERVRIINAYADGELINLCSVDMLLFGFDLSAQVGRDVTVESMSDAKPTASRTNQRQKNGRVLRCKPYPALIFDHAGNFNRHGLPCQPQEWSLDGRKKRPRNADVDVISSERQCGNCFFRTKLVVKACPDCGEPYPIAARIDMKEVDGDLVELQKQEAKKQNRREEGMCETLEDWMELAKERGYKKGWAFKRYEMRKGK